MIFIFVLFLSSAQVRAQAPNLILHNGNIITLDDKLATVSAVAIQGDKLLSLGTSEQVLKLAEAQTKIIDLKQEP